jgi:hypothetical protein
MSTMPGLQRLQTTSIPAPTYIDDGETARPGNAHNHTEALWFQQQQHQQQQQQQPADDAEEDAENDADGAQQDCTYKHKVAPHGYLLILISTASTSSLLSTNTGLSRPLTAAESSLLADLDRLKFFLATAPGRWDAKPEVAGNHPALNRFLLPNQEFVTCVLWNGLYHITGTDIVRALVFRCVLPPVFHIKHEINN